ncbi:unnamed protein product [Anisakis simplex]|uniref:Lipase (inferred by orthology to a zebrafish protein) n=1 Tax=Anisakis simplex TaxID=6269 RepID=A0A0M3J2V1_ANISI|nr:unnamed protein product [Anisakis simplex]
MRITKPFAVLMTVSVLYATEPPEVHMNVMEIIAYYGYPAELVDVKTDDGYFLQMHRIPHGKNETGSEPYGKRPVVFLQHGLLASSADWVINTDKNSAGITAKLLVTSTKNACNEMNS